MSIVPFSALSNSDLSSLGNNVGAPKRRSRRRLLDALNRSLITIAHAVAELRHRQAGGSQSAPLPPLPVTHEHPADCPPGL